MELIVEDVTKTIRSRRVLQQISLQVSGGEVVGLEGVNGSGKTMLMRTVCGLVRPTSGRVVIDGEVIGKDRDMPQSLGVLIENPAFLDAYTGWENLELLARLRGTYIRAELEHILERVGLDPRDTRRYRAYSLGMRQRLGIAAAVMQRPDLLIFDEPTNALDADGVEMVIRLICEERDRGAAVIVACHDHTVMRRVADRIYHMVEGSIVGCEEVGHEAS